MAIVMGTDDGLRSLGRPIFEGQQRLSSPLKIFVASPSDVARERDIAVETAEDVGRQYASMDGTAIEVVCWTKNAVPGYGADAQTLINEQIAEMSQYDLFVGIMWNRIGTRTPRTQSGTVEEFQRAEAARLQHRRPDIWFYFRDAAARLETRHALAQKRRVIEFRRKVRLHGLPFDYTSAGAFGRLFRQHLISWLDKRRENAFAQAESASSEYTLRFLDGPLASRSFALSEGDATEIGRDPTLPICIAEPTVSRRHAAITRRGQQCMLEDLGSPSGTYINGQRHQSWLLESGDVVRFGHASTAVFSSPSSPRPSLAVSIDAWSDHTVNGGQPRVLRAHGLEMFSQCASLSPDGASVLERCIRDFLTMVREHPETTWPFPHDPSLSYTGNVLRTAIRLGNRVLYQKSDSELRARLPTSIAIAIFDKGRMAFTAVGNMSCIRFRREEAALLVSGSQSVAVLSQSLSLVRRASCLGLGVHEDIDVDVYESRCQPGDIVVLCPVNVEPFLQDLDAFLATGPVLSSASNAADRVRAGLKLVGADHLSPVLVLLASPDTRVQLSE